MAQRPLLTPTIVCVFPVFGSKVLQLNQICIFSSDYTEDFPGVFQTPLEYCFEKGSTEECFRENCISQLSFNVYTARAAYAWIMLLLPICIFCASDSDVRYANSAIHCVMSYY